MSKSKKASAPPRIAKRSPVKAVIDKALKTSRFLSHPDIPEKILSKGKGAPQHFAMGGIAKIRLGQSTKDGKPLKPKKGKN